VKNIVKEQFLVSTFFTFYLVHSSQIGIGILSFQREVSKNAQQDAWLSVIIAGISIHILIWLIYQTLDEKHNDLVAVHDFCFGQVIGNILSILVLFYFLLSAFAVFRTYIQIIQVWVFPTIKTWQLALVLGVMIYYIVSGGFRILTGFSVWGVIIPAFLLLLLYFPLRYMNPRLLMPVFNHTVKDILLSTKASVLLFVGFEWIYMYYPFIKGAKKSQKWAHLANGISTVLYLIVLVVSFMYINQDTLQHATWATLFMTKIIELPFIERFEYIFIFIWILVIIPTLCIPIWACTRILKRITNSSHFKPKISLAFFIIVMIVAATFIENFVEVDKLGKFISNAGFYFLYIYIPFIFLMKLFRHQLTKMLSKAQ